MCFKSNPEYVAKLLRTTADVVDMMINDPNNENVKYLATLVEELHEEIDGVLLDTIDLDALMHSFL
jgi:hypothetical protein